MNAKTAALMIALFRDENVRFPTKGSIVVSYEEKKIVFRIVLVVRNPERQFDVERKYNDPDDMRISLVVNSDSFKSMTGPNPGCFDVSFQKFGPCPFDADYAVLPQIYKIVGGKKSPINITVRNGRPWLPDGKPLELSKFDETWSL